MALLRQTFPVGALGCNCTIVACPETSEALVIDPGDEAVAFGRRGARALHPPGHTPGSVCLFLERDGETPLLFAGDTLFRGSIGRTDLWGGSLPTIKASIRGRLLTLPETTVVVPGH